jgi:hypothetical protein
MQIDECRIARGAPACSVRVICRQPGDGYAHPAGRTDVLRLLHQLPPRYRYRLRSIELLPAPPRGRAAAPVLGRLDLPGRVVLYAQPSAPWLLRGVLSDIERQRLQRAGAEISVDWRSCLTVVTWPEHSLRDFMLYDVLIHELAHHAAQARRTRSARRKARTAEHEAVAHGLASRETTRLARSTVEDG